MILTEPEVRLVALALSPAYVVERARDLGRGSAVLGAEAAYWEARDMVRELISHAAEREGLSESFVEAEELARFFSLDSRVQRVEALESTPWRLHSAACHGEDSPWQIGAGCEITGLPEKLPRSIFRGACMVALAEALALRPELNRCWIDGRPWQRTSAEILYPLRFALDDLSGVIVEAEGLSPREAWKAQQEARRALGEARSHPIWPVVDQLWRQWTEWGYIASPAGAMFSDLGGSGITHPRPAMLRRNAVGISVVAGDRDRSGSIWVDIVCDHRILDPAEASAIHRVMREEVPRLCHASS